VGVHHGRDAWHVARVGDYCVTPEVEKQILYYLQKQNEADVEGTLRTLANEVASTRVLVAEFKAELRGELRGVSLRVGLLEDSRDKTQTRLDQSGNWQLEDLRERSKWSSRLVITTLMGVAVALLSGAMGVLVTMMLKK
jgi:predicted RNA polymerase sigma factor